MAIYEQLVNKSNTGFLQVGVPRGPTPYCVAKIISRRFDQFGEDAPVRDRASKFLPKVTAMCALGKGYFQTRPNQSQLQGAVHPTVEMLLQGHAATSNLLLVSDRLTPAVHPIERSSSDTPSSTDAGAVRLGDLAELLQRFAP